MNLTTLNILAATSSDEAAGAVFGIMFLLFWLIFAAAIFGLFVWWIITLIHSIQYEDVPDRVLWIVLHFVVGAIIAPIYWFAVKKPYDKKKKTAHAAHHVKK